jgi:Tfp pilus assembly protein PilF
MRERYIAGMVLLVTAITYLGTLQFDFVSDDIRQVLLNPFIKAWRYVPHYFTSSIWKQLEPFSSGNSYRPLFLLLLKINFSTFHNRPFGWHLAAIGLHVLVTWLVFLVVKNMTGEFTLAWLSALIFGAHPIHHEVVAWISGMTESLFAALLLISFLAYLRSLESSKRPWMAISCLFYALALLSKETAIILPAMVFAYGWIGYRPDGGGGSPSDINRIKRALAPALWYLPIAILYMILRRWALAGLTHMDSGTSLGTWLLTLPSILFLYFKHWLFPIHLAESYDLLYQPKFTVLHVLLPALIVLAAGYAVWLLRDRLGSRALACAAVWVVFPILPAMDTFALRPEDLVHDRYFYAPSVGAALFMALVVERLARSEAGVFGQSARVVAMGLGLTIVLGLLATRESSFWINNYALFSRAHQIAPLNVMASSSLAGEMLARGELDAAGSLLEENYRQHEADYRVEYNLGRVLYAKHQFLQAAEFARSAVVLSPNFSDGYISLGAIELKLGQRAEAQETFRRAVEAGPYSASAHTTYGIVLALSGNCTGATQQFQAALELNPGDAITEAQLYRCRTVPSAPLSSKPGQP